MKTQELRIGNLLQSKVQLNFTDLKIPKYAMVDIVMLMDLQRLGADKWAFEPIPITEEWLLRFGFAFNSDNDEFQLSPVALDCIRTGRYRGKWITLYKKTVIETEIKYAHQLQNIYFALTGKELPIYQ